MAPEVSAGDRDRNPARFCAPSPPSDRSLPQVPFDRAASDRPPGADGPRYTFRKAEHFMRACPSVSPPQADHSLHSPPEATPHHPFFFPRLLTATAQYLLPAATAELHPARHALAQRSPRLARDAVHSPPTLCASSSPPCIAVSPPTAAPRSSRRSPAPFSLAPFTPFLTPSPSPPSPVTPSPAHFSPSSDPVFPRVSCPSRLLAATCVSTAHSRRSPLLSTFLPLRDPRYPHISTAA